MSRPFLHGVEVEEATGGARPIQAVETGIVGLVGTAGKGPVNVPTLISGSRRDAVLEFGEGVGTIPDALDAIFDQAGARVVVVNVLDPATHKVAVAAKDYLLAGDSAMLDDRYAANVVVNAGIGGAGGLQAVDVDYTYNPDTGVLTRVAGGGIAADSTVNVAYDRIDETAVTVAQVLGGVSADGVYTGAEAFIQAEADLGVRPKILIAPGYTSETTVAANVITGAPVATGLESVADRLRAVIVADGPNTTDADALLFRGTIGSRRVYVVDPWVTILDSNSDEVLEGASARVAGLIAKNDSTPGRGFWWSPSNNTLSGVVGTGRPIDFILGDPASRANALNAAEVATVIRVNGYRLWGNRTCSNDLKWAFLSVVRTADAINEALLRSHLWAVDRNIGKTYLDDVAEGVNAYLRGLTGVGAILGGRCWPDPDLNTAASIAAGEAYFNFDFTPSYPAERITFRSHLVDDYVETIL